MNATCLSMALLTSMIPSALGHARIIILKIQDQRPCQRERIHLSWSPVTRIHPQRGVCETPPVRSEIISNDWLLALDSLVPAAHFFSGCVRLLIGGCLWDPRIPRRLGCSTAVYPGQLRDKVGSGLTKWSVDTVQGPVRPHRIANERTSGNGSSRVMTSSIVRAFFPFIALFNSVPGLRLWTMVQTSHSIGTLFFLFSRASIPELSWASGVFPGVIRADGDEPSGSDEHSF